MALTAITWPACYTPGMQQAGQAAGETHGETHGAHLEASLEVGDGCLRVCGDDGHRVGGGHKEVAAQHHVAVAVAVCRGQGQVGSGGDSGGCGERVGVLESPAICMNDEPAPERQPGRQSGTPGSPT